MTKSNAPANAATQDDLPQTAVKPRGKDLLLQQMQDKLAAYADPSEHVIEPQSASEEDTFKKRYSDLRRFAQQKEAGFSKEITELRAQISQLTVAQNAPLPKTRDEFEAWKNKYPDIVGFIEIIAEERANAAKTQVVEELSTVKSKLAETEKEKAFATLKVLVPDLEDILPSAAYKTWFSVQPHFIQEILNTSDDPHQIAYYMNVFKSSLAPARPKSKSDALDALSTSVKSTGTTPSNTSGKWKFTQSQIAKMSPQEYDVREADIIEARNAGQILDDVSKRNSVFDM